MTSTSAFERHRQRREEVALEHLDTVGPRAGDGTTVDVGGDDTRPGRAVVRTLAIAPDPVQRSIAVPPVGQPRHGSARQRLTLPTWDVHAGIDADVDLAELHVTGDPGQRFPREATFDDGAQEDGIAGGMRDEVIRLVLRRDETGFGEPGDECATIGRERHVRHWSTWGRSPVTRLLCHPTALSPDCYVTRPRSER